MKFMLMMHAPRAGWETAGIATWPTDDIKAHIGFMMHFGQGAEGSRRIGRRRRAGRRPSTPESCARARAARPSDRRPVRRSERVPRRLLDRGRRDPRARLRDRRARVGGARQGRRAVNMPIEVRQVMSAPPVEAVMDVALSSERRAPAARPRAAGARRRRPALRRLRRRGRCRPGGADRRERRSGRATASRQSARLADPGRRAPDDGSHPRRARAPPARSDRRHADARLMSRSCLRPTAAMPPSRTTR